jgi:hypothetical protein
MCAVTRVALIAPAGASSSHGIVDQARRGLETLIDLGHDASLHVVVSRAAQPPNPSGNRRLDIVERQASLSGVWGTLPDSPDVLWVHWANYGLSQSRALGVPSAFARRLRAWHAQRKTAAVALSVHEGWDAPPGGEAWKRLRADRQRRALERAALACDRVSVNCDRWLGAQWATPGAPVTKLPTFSNFPAPNRAMAGGDRRDVVVMGGAEVRAHLLRHLASTDSWGPLHPAAVSRIHDIGAGPQDHRAIGGVPVISHGFLPQQAVSDVLATCVMGVIDIPDDVAGKSSIAAAYRELGLMTLNLSTDTVIPPDGELLAGLDRSVRWLLDS